MSHKNGLDSLLHFPTKPVMIAYRIISSIFVFIFCCLFRILPLFLSPYPCRFPFHFTDFNVMCKTSRSTLTLPRYLLQCEIGNDDKMRCCSAETAPSNVSFTSLIIRNRMSGHQKKSLKRIIAFPEGSNWVCFKIASLPPFLHRPALLIWHLLEPILISQLMSSIGSYGESISASLSQVSSTSDLAEFCTGRGLT